MKLSAVIITGAARYEKALNLVQMRSPIWKLCTETLKQLESEQYIVGQLGFTPRSPHLLDESVKELLMAECSCGHHETVNPRNWKVVGSKTTKLCWLCGGPR